MLPRLFILIVVFTLLACGEPEDLPTEVHDLRILAVAADPPELLYDRASGSFDSEAVTFTALVADPRGGAMNVRWSFCPVESNSACADWEAKRDAAPEPLRPMLETLRKLALAGAARPIEGERGGFSVDPFAVRPDPLLIDYHLAASGLGMGNGGWSSAEITVETGAEALTALKRVVLAPRDLAQWNPELRQHAGFQVCDGVATTDDCLAVPARQPNRNPQIAAMEVARSKRADAPFTVEPLPLKVRAGEELRLRPLLAPDAQERFFVIDAAFQDHRLQVVEKQEEAVISWFATAGELEDEHTSAPLTKTLDNLLTIDKTAAAGERISLWMVVRDQRGGVGWSHLPLVVE
jgi:hypothetical protein